MQCVSAITGEGIADLLAFIETRVNASHETIEFTLDAAAAPWIIGFTRTAKFCRVSSMRKPLELQDTHSGRKEGDLDEPPGGLRRPERPAGRLFLRLCLIPKPVHLR